MQQFTDDSLKSGKPFTVSPFIPHPHGATMRLIIGAFNVDDTTRAQDQIPRNGKYEILLLKEFRRR